MSRFCPLISHNWACFDKLKLSHSVSVQLLSRVRLFVTPWTAAHKASLSITNSLNLLKLMSIESVMPSKPLILCHPFLFLPSIFFSISSVAQSCPLFATPWIAARQASLSITNSWSSLRLTCIKVSDIIQPSHPLSSLSPPAPNPSQHQSFPMSQLFTWGGQSTGVSALASFLPEKSQGWSPSEWTGWISLQSKGLSRVFSNTTVQKHQFFSAQLYLQSNSHIHTWPLEKP